MVRWSEYIDIQRPVGRFIVEESIMLISKPKPQKSLLKSNKIIFTEDEAGSISKIRGYINAFNKQVDTFNNKEVYYAELANLRSQVYEYMTHDTVHLQYVNLTLHKFKPFDPIDTRNGNPKHEHNKKW